MRFTMTDRLTYVRQLLVAALLLSTLFTPACLPPGSPDASITDAAPDASDASHAEASTTLPSRSEVDPWLQTIFDQHYIHAMVVAMEDSNGSVVYGYGTIGASGPAPAGDTILPIGSVSKTFTGLWLATQILSGNVQANEPVQQLLPAGVTVPTFNGTAITLEDLATHTSGLPDSDSTHPTTNPLDPWADYTVADLYAFLGSYALTYAPGTRYVYSNYGEGLLGLALSLQAGGTWNANIQRVIAGPLGLVDTTSQLSATQQARRAPGYDADLNPQQPWNFTEATAGSGSLQSTANDMLAYAAAEAGITTTPLQAAMALSQQQIHPTDAAGMGIGLNWFMITGRNIIWHNGGVGDGVSFVGFDPVAHKAVVVMTDTGALGTLTALGAGIPTMIGLPLLHRLQDSTYTLPNLGMFLPPQASLTGAQLQAYAGTYAFPDGSTVLVSADSGRLLVTAPAVSPRPIGLYPTSATTFVTRTLIGGSAAFQAGGDGGPSTATFSLNGQTITGTKQ
jgi:CubicO group peptidase (beta-lactamase class C family)